MKMSDRGRELLAEWEGIRLHEYKDSAGNPTIGVGHFIRYDEEHSGLLHVDGGRIPWRYGITRAEALALLSEDLRSVEDLLNGRVRVELTQNQFDALCSLVFNIGGNRFLDSTILRCLDAGNLDAVPDQFMRWVNAGGQRLMGLVERRAKEVALWEGRL